MRSNLYDWMKMSDDHRRYAERNYPVAARLGLGSPTYEEYAGKVRSLMGRTKAQFLREFQHWYCEYGATWNMLGGIQEYSVGEYTKSYQTVGPNTNRRPSFRPDHLRGLEDWELEQGQSVWYPEPDDLETGTSDPWADDWTIGTPSTTPTVPTGFFWCMSPPSGIRQTATESALSAWPGWARSTWAGADNQLYYRYRHANTNTEKWACPKSNAASSRQVEDVKTIQRALLRAGFDPGKIDGKVGPNTCAAAYEAKRQLLNQTDATLGEDFYSALGLTGKGFGEKYARLCAFYHKASVTPTPKPVEPRPIEPRPIEPKPVDPIVIPVPEARAGFPWWIAGLLGLGIAGALAFSDKGQE